MKTRMFHLGIVLVLLALGGWLVAQAFAAPATVGPRVPRTPLVIKSPDLVIQKVTVYQEQGGEFPPIHVTVYVKNIGAAGAGASLTMIMMSPDVETPVPGVLRAVSTPSIAAGATEMVKLEMAGIPRKVWMVFLADAPGSASPLGVVGEGLSTTAAAPKGELNNSFALPWNMDVGNPQTFLNPLVY